VEKKVLITITSPLDDSSISPIKSDEKTNQFDQKKVIQTNGSELIQRKKSKSQEQTNGKHSVSKHDTKPAVLQKPKNTNKPDEFGGVFGSLMILLTCPLFFLMFVYVTAKQGYSITEINLPSFQAEILKGANRTTYEIIGWFSLFHAIVYILPFGHIMLGPVTPKGVRLPYRISAKHTLFFTIVAYALLVGLNGRLSRYFNIDVSYFHSNIFPLTLAATIVSLIGTVFVYLKSFLVPKEDLNPNASTGAFTYDLFMGREMHPRLTKFFDLKMYLYRVAMGGWLVVIMLHLHEAYNADKEGFFTMKYAQLHAVAISQALYVILEFFWDEEQCPYMYDIKNEGLGFVQIYGELVIVPFVYSLPVRYVLDNPMKDMSLVYLISSVALLVIGLSFVVGSGLQKSMFRKNPYDPKVRHLDSIPSSRPGGDRMLVSGYWGVCRHPNYLGELLIALGWSLLCGFDHLIVWYYPVFVVVLLLHRALRDERRCHERHGYTWKMYCERVRYRVIPYVF